MSILITSQNGYQITPEEAGTAFLSHTQHLGGAAAGAWAEMTVGMSGFMLPPAPKHAGSVTSIHSGLPFNNG